MQLLFAGLDRIDKVEILDEVHVNSRFLCSYMNFIFNGQATCLVILTLWTDYDICRTEYVTIRKVRIFYEWNTNWEHVMEWPFYPAWWLKIHVIYFIESKQCIALFEKSN